MMETWREIERLRRYYFNHALAASQHPWEECGLHLFAFIPSGAAVCVQHIHHLPEGESMVLSGMKHK